MKTLIYLILSLLLLGCKKQNLDPPAEIKDIVGTWRLDAVEKMVNGQVVWEEVAFNPDDPNVSFTIRFDGVLLGRDGLPPCCGLDSYSVDGKPYLVKPKRPVPHNSHCDLINCASCPRNMIGQDGELIVVATCEKFTTRAKYVRE